MQGNGTEHVHFLFIVKTMYTYIYLYFYGVPNGAKTLINHSSVNLLELSSLAHIWKLGVISLLLICPQGAL